MEPNEGLGELGALGVYFSKGWERKYDHCRKMVSIGCSSIYVIKITTEHTEHTESTEGAQETVLMQNKRLERRITT